MAKRIEITWDENGEMRIQTEGFQGKTCLKEIEDFIASASKEGLKLDTRKVTPTKEFYAKTEQRVTTSA